MHLTSQQPVIDWAVAREIPTKARPLEQMAVTLEEIGEVKQWLDVLSILRGKLARGKLDYKESIPGYVWEFIDFNLGPKDATKLSLAYPVNMQALVDLIEFNLSLELGDILVTLCIQCHMQGFGFGDCIPLHIMSVDGDDVARTWENVDLFASQLSVAIATKSSFGITTNVLSLYRCVDELAGEIGLSCDKCLTRAYEKIKDREGAMSASGKWEKKVA